MNNSIDSDVTGKGSIYEVPQQLLGGEDVPYEVGHALARACVVHCAAAAVDVEHAPSVDELKDFVIEHGSGSGSEFYIEGTGWDVVGVADLLRHDGYSVISQNLNYGSGELDIKRATDARRVTSDFEKQRLVLLSEYGGKDRNKWTNAIFHTGAYGGKVIASIEIPLISGDGFGTHAVLVKELDEQEGTITYFDPDHYNMARFGEKKPKIQRIHKTELIYKRPIHEFISVMTGELIHLYPPKNNVINLE